MSVSAARRDHGSSCQYERAQKEIARRRSELPRHRSDEDLLQALRSILDKNGRISVELIERTPNTPSQLTYRKRFGNLIRAYSMVGYKIVWDEGWLKKRQFVHQLREDLMKKIVEADPTRVIFEDRGGVFRSRLRLQDGRFISVVASRPHRCYGEGVRWVVKPARDEFTLPILLARLNPQCDSFRDLFVIPPFRRAGAHYLKEYDSLLRNAVRLTELKDFYASIEQVSARRS